MRNLKYDAESLRTAINSLRHSCQADGCIERRTAIWLCDEAEKAVEEIDRITKDGTSAVSAAYEDAANIADMYSETNMQQAGDTILLDPFLQGSGFSPENIDTSMQLQLDGCIHSARHCASRDIAAAIRALKDSTARSANGELG